jgi:phospholipid-translocating ATPase
MSFTTSSTPYSRPSDWQTAEASNSASLNARPQLYVDTNTAPRRQSISSTPPRSHEERHSINEANPPSSRAPSIRSQRSDQPRVRFSNDVQTLGERAIVSPSITADEALARLQHTPSQSSVNRIAGSEPPPFTLTSPQKPQIRGILRTPSQTSAQSYPLISAQQRRAGRSRAWSLRRQLWPKQEDIVNPRFSDIEIGLSTLPPLGPQVATPRAEPRVSDVDAIRVVNDALDQARIDPPIASIQPKSSGEKKLPVIEPEQTEASLPFYSTWAASRRTRHMLIERCKEITRRIKRLRDPRLISKGKGREIPIDVPDRGKTHLIDDRTGREYVDNLITSSRYTVYSFLPRQLWAQFSKVANL